MESLEAELTRAREADVAAIADAVEAIGFECTRCGACCRGHGTDHTATVFPDEVREIRGTDPDYDWRDVARPTPFGLDGGDDAAGDGSGDSDSDVYGDERRGDETFEWALQTDACGDCAFYEEFDDEDGAEPEGRDSGRRDGGDREDADWSHDRPDGRCTVYEDRPLVCRTYPFSLALGGTDQPMGGVVDEEGLVRAHECEGLGRDISRADAEDLARTLKERAVRGLEEAVAVRESYDPTDPAPGETVVHDSEGAKRPDGRPYRE